MSAIAPDFRFGHIRLERRKQGRYRAFGIDGGELILGRAAHRFDDEQGLDDHNQVDQAEYRTQAMTLERRPAPIGGVSLLRVPLTPAPAR